jgi:DNA mismatch repair protein MutL
MAVRRLSDNIVNQIAAGEVIERPASVVRELLDNAIDAKATRIEIVTSNGGKSLIRITDNGTGMSREDLQLAVERHCTSKLVDDLSAINSLGFRGEALPSIGSVARLSMRSRLANENTGWEIGVEGGQIFDPKPAALSEGTVVEVADLFYATPARLKFLKTDRAEANSITDVVKRTILGHPNIHFSVSGSDRQSAEYPSVTGDDATTKRMAQVLGDEFIDNGLIVDAEREGVFLKGISSLPTYNRGNALHQFFYVNGRSVKDKQITGAIRGAYMDFLSRYRHPVCCLFLEIDPALVDVNVHPAKSEVRFRDSGLVRGLIVGALREAISSAGHRSSTEGGRDMLGAFQAQSNPTRPAPSPSTHSGNQNQQRQGYQGQGNQNYDWQKSAFRPVQEEAPASPSGFSESPQQGFDVAAAPSADIRETEDTQHLQTLPLGAARAQLHENYIITQTDDGLVIVDQHAAHERLVYEKMKAQMARDGISGQMLLIPDIVELPEEDVNRLLDHAEGLEAFGLTIESFGPGAVAVRATPAVLGEIDSHALLRDLVDEIGEWGSSDLVSEKVDYVAATMSCHGSIRSGRRLKPQEMDQLLRDMEATPNSGQCNHGRPTYVELKLKDIERLFGRS